MSLNKKKICMLIYNNKVILIFQIIFLINILRIINVNIIKRLLKITAHIY